MRRSTPFIVSAALAGVVLSQKTHRNHSSFDASENPFAIYRDDRPDDCPPCFNCNLEDFQCHQFAPCSRANGKCNCPPGFGGEDCSDPVCGSLADGRERAPRKDRYCDCKDGWEGINCNVCKTDGACNSFMPEGEDGVCFKEGLLVKENYQICDITNRKILDQLKDQKPQATFACNAETEECNFQCMCMESVCDAC